MGLNVAQVLAGTLQILKQRWAPLLGLWLLYFAVLMAAMLIFGLMVGTASLAGLSAMNTGSMEALAGGFFASMILFYVGYLLIYFAQMASMTAKASPVQDLLFGQAVFAGVRCAFTLLVVTILLLVVYFIFALILGLVAGVISLAGSAVSTVASLLLLPVIIYIGIRLSLLVPVAAVEGTLNPLTVINRSFELTRGNVLPIFLAWLVYAVALAVLGLLLFLPIWNSLSSATGPGAGELIYLVVGACVFGVVFLLSQTAMMAVIHGQLTGTADKNLHETFT